ncbi:MAG: hypothetical protein KGS49_19095, partial [Planctomycetes bacterium]|nr:hypothetical protein [Planctomycetota bacterium]
SLALTAHRENQTMGNSEFTILHQAMVAPDDFAVRLRYRSQNGELTERVISPIKMADSRSLLALCLCRENPRRFELDRCSHIELVPAHEILMPMELRVIEAAPAKPPRKPRKKNADETVPKEKVSA